MKVNVLSGRRYKRRLMLVVFLFCSYFMEIIVQLVYEVITMLRINSICL